MKRKCNKKTNKQEYIYNNAITNDKKYKELDKVMSKSLPKYREELSTVLADNSTASKEQIVEEIKKSEMQDKLYKKRVREQYKGLLANVTVYLVLLTSAFGTLIAAVMLKQQGYDEVTVRLLLTITFICCAAGLLFRGKHNKK